MIQLRFKNDAEKHPLAAGLRSMTATAATATATAAPRAAALATVVARAPPRRLVRADRLPRVPAQVAQHLHVRDVDAAIALVEFAKRLRHARGCFSASFLKRN